MDFKTLMDEIDMPEEEAVKLIGRMMLCLMELDTAGKSGDLNKIITASENFTTVLKNLRSRLNAPGETPAPTAVVLNS